MAPIRGVILDVDGTLVDSNDAHAQAWVEAMREFGYPVAFEEVRPLIGMGGDKLLPAAIGVEKTSEIGQKIDECRKQIFEAKYLPHLKAFPATRRLLKRMRQRGLKLAVASSAPKKELNSLLRITGAEDLIEDQTSSSDVERSKPDPDIVRAALDKLNLPPDQAVMLADTPYDLDAASRAGLSMIALRCGGWGDSDLSGSLAIYDDPADLLRHYDSSPLSTG